jgi:hypothetical protein
MAHEAATATAPKTLGLPPLVSSPADVGRLIRELEAIDERFLQLKLRRGGGQPSLPKTSYLLDRLAGLNGFNLLDGNDRQRLRDFLELVKQQAPLLHISFSADPTPAFLEKLMAWLRQEIHAQVLVSIGLQPNIGAGCIVRTTNRRFDFSLRQNFIESRPLLISKLVAINDKARA